MQIIAGVLGTLLGVVAFCMLFLNSSSKEKKGEGYTFYIVGIILMIISFSLLAYSGILFSPDDGVVIRRP